MARLPVPVKDGDSIAPGEKSEVSSGLLKDDQQFPGAEMEGHGVPRSSFCCPCRAGPSRTSSGNKWGGEGANRLAVFVLTWAIHDEGRTALVERVQGFRVVPPAVCGIFPQLVISNPSGPLMA